MIRAQPQISLRALFLLVTLVACFIGMYASLWKSSPLLPAFITVITASLLGVAMQWQRNRCSIGGPIIGGIVGANLAVSAHFVCGYTMLDFFEDEGLGLIGGVWIFAPYATICGIVLGGFVWFIVLAVDSMNIGRRAVGTRV